MNSNIRDVYSLTPAQEGIYVQCFQSEDAKTYHFHSLCQINKNTDLELLKKSAELLFLRHPVLKSAITVLKSTNAIKQVILENRNCEFTVLLQEGFFSQKVLDEIVERDRKKPLNLQTDTLFKVIVIEFSDKRFMLFRSHHIILDGWCFPIIINDFQRYYEQLSGGKSMKELSDEINKEVLSQTSFAQYVNWLKKQDKSEAVTYWKDLLKDSSFPHIFNKSDDRINKETVTFRTYINKETSQKIEGFAKQNKVSNNTIFESAFSIALQKFSGSNDVLFDKVISGRSIPLKNIENTVGLFVNTLPVRTKSDENTTLADFIKQTQIQTIETNKHGILALSEVYKTCNINGRLIDALFAFENYYIGEDITEDMEKGILSPEYMFFDEKTEFNLSVAVFKEKSEYIIRTTYSSDLYTDVEMSEFVKGYISILESFSDTAKYVRDVSVADADLIENFNQTAHCYDMPEDSTLYSLFERTAKENEDKICIRTSDKNMTFGELLEKSGNLDTEIRRITGDKKSVVAVIAERSPEMYSAIYGIIRGGNAYLPIDPDYPQERIEYILENSEAKAVVVQGKFINKVKNTPVIDMTELLNSAEKTKAPLCAAKPEDTAYVIYTSGSTGNPKGAKVSHRSAVNRILWMHDKYPLGKDDVILQKTPYTFDVSVWEHFWWGMCGGSLAVSKPGEHFLPAKILEETNKNKVTHIHFVPSVFELFLNYLESHREEISKFNSVRYVFLSGEALTADLVQRFYKLYDFEKVTIHNLYGPTECAVDVTYYDCVPTDTDPVPIGKPVYNTQIHILDKYLKVVPVGVVGELCIAGMNVGQGYLNNPELTAEKFVDNPFGEGKMYRTGDNAYFREDGNIIFVGRKDNQIKLNGQRIEVGEIESVISSIDGVETVAVTVRKFNDKDVLVAFITGDCNCAEMVKEICSIKLPKYMVPGVVMYLDSLPLNRNGKLDRNRLADINVTFVQGQQNEEPINETEERICRIFESVLQADKIGRNSDFFDMGGTSLSMISVLSEVGFENVSAADFMRNSTPAKLTVALSRTKNGNYEFLEPLHIVENSSKALILLPFAGGNAEAYANMVREMEKSEDSVSVYFIRFLHSYDECSRAADEIISALNKEKVYIYSHCVGSAVAMQIIRYLENRKFEISRYFAGASIPASKPSKRNGWNIVPDSVLKHKLVKAGADFDSLSDRRLEMLFKTFRKDTGFSSISFYEFKSRLKTPVNIIVSKNDIFTKNYTMAQNLWERYFENVSDVHFINTQSHYFQRDNCSELLNVIISEM